MAARPKIGEPFNPWRGACGFFAPDVVRASRLVYRFDDKSAGQSREKRLTQGDNAVYESLVRFAGRNGVCHPSQATLANKLGVSERQIRKNLQALEWAGLIRWKIGGKTKGGTPLAARYEFIWNPVFERNSGSAPREVSSSGRQGTVVPVVSGYGAPLGTRVFCFSHSF